jgi:hypothetical protein
LERKYYLEVGHTITSGVDPSHAKFTGKRCPPKGDTQTMINQSGIAFEIKDTLEVGHNNTNEVNPSQVAQSHKDIFALGVSHVRLHY